MRATAAITLGTLALLAGCASMPEFRAAPTAPPERWQARAAAGSLVTTPEEPSSTAPRDWWAALEDPVLDRLMVAAVERNLDVQRARERIREARTAITIADARLHPVLNAGLRAGRRNTEPIGREQATSLFEATFDASWEIDLFGATRSRADATRSLAQGAEHDEQAVVLSLRAEVARNYVDLRAAQRRQDLARSMLASAEEIARLAASLQRAGLRSELDTAQARSHALVLQAAIPAYETAAAVAIRRIETLLGHVPGELDAELRPAAAVPDAVRPALLDAPAAVIARRPDLRRAATEFQAASALAHAATADLYPKLSLGGLLGIRDTSNNASLGIASVAAGLLAPIFNAGRLRSEAEAADARRQQAWLAYRQSILGALEEVEGSLVGYTNAERQRASLARLADNEAGKLALALSRYRSGLTPFLDVLEAQRSAFAAQSDLVFAQSLAARSYVALAKAVGG